MSASADFEREGADWPNRRFSRFVEAGGLCWHVQVLGKGPDILLVHGTGAASHSFAALAPLLARRWRVIVPDLPGHGFTAIATAPQSALPGMARALAALTLQLDARPVLVAGHSAGAAVLARMCLDGAIDPDALVSLNGALLPLHGGYRSLYTGAARLMAAAPLVPRLFARRARDRAVVERLIGQTGSRLPPEAVTCYARLMTCERHVAGALRMMANWDLEPLARELNLLRPALHLVACANDRTVKPSQAERVATLMPRARVHRVEGLGHLGHEEDPVRFAGLIGDIAKAPGHL